MDNEQLTREVMTMRQDMAGLTEQVKAAFKRIDEQKKLTETVHELAASIKVLTERMEQAARRTEQADKEQARLRTDVDALRLKPAGRWEHLVGQAITLIVAAVLGGVISKVF